MKKFDYTLSALDMDVIHQIGGICKNLPGGVCEISDEAADELANVRACPSGAAGGFRGFIYYTETRLFTARNRSKIVNRLREQIAEGLFDDGTGKVKSVIGAVMMYSCLKNDPPEEIEEEAARVLFGAGAMFERNDRVSTALAWGALEDLAFSLDDREITDAETETK